MANSSDSMHSGDHQTGENLTEQRATTEKGSPALAAWNDTRVDYPRDSSITECFTNRMTMHPDAVALVDDQRSVTYAELDRRARGVASRLLKLGATRGDRIAVCLQRSSDLVVILLGILRAGCAYVPLDPGFPDQRLRFMVRDARAKLLLADGRAMTGFNEVACTTVTVADILDRTPTNESDAASYPSVGPHDLAYIVYTSGSTGRPKGVMVEHRAVLRLCCNSGFAPLGSDDVVAHLSNVSFDAATWELWGTLLSGAQLVIFGQDSVLSSSLTSDLRARRVSAAFITTALFHRIVQQRPDAWSSLRHLLFGGQAIDPARVQAVVRHGAPERLLHVYGPTECVTFSTWHHVLDVDEHATTVSIGTPLNNLTCYVLDEHGNRASVGNPGELYVGGDALARGYHDDPRLTAVRFLPDPFTDVPGRRMYRTGDIVRQSPDGGLAFVGRVDDQIKLRGFRIELGEVETALREHAAIDDVVVALRPSPQAETRSDAQDPDSESEQKVLVAYFTQGSVATPGVEELHSFLADKLPAFMIPGLFVALNELPLSAVGKVDRAALPSPAGIALTAGHGYVSPRTPVEATLAQLWAEMLGIERVGVEDDFFALGGDSILSIHIAGKGAQEGLTFSPTQLMRARNIATLAGMVTEGRDTGTDELVSGPVALTPIQRWYIEQEPSEPHHFNQAYFLNVLDTLDLDRLTRALQHLVHHHDALRMRYEWRGRDVAQINGSERDTPAVEFVDLSSLSAADQRRALVQTADREHTRLNLDHGPLLRVTYFDLGANGRRLFFVIHHLVIDGVSWHILLTDMERAYQQLGEGSPVLLPHKTSSFQAWAQRLAAHARSEALRSQLPMWLSLPWRGVAPLPVDYPGGGNTLADARTETFWFDESVTISLLREVPARLRVKINEILLAALLLALRSWSGQRVQHVDIEGHGRENLFDDINLARTVGWFTTIYPVLFELESDEPAHVLQVVHDHMSQIPHNGISFGLLRYLSDEPAIEAQLRSLPHADISFNYLGQWDHTLKKSSLFRLTNEPIGARFSPALSQSHLLAFQGRIIENGLECRLRYSTGLYKESTIAALIAEFRERLHAFAELGETRRALSPGDVPLTGLDAEQLASVVERTLAEKASEARLHIADIYPLTPLQMGMLHHALNDTGAGEYVVQMLCEVTGIVDAATLKRALRVLGARHSALRTSFVWHQLTNPLQIEHRAGHIPLVTVDLRSLTRAEQENRLQEYLAADRQRGFQLDQLPLVRAWLCRRQADQATLVLTFHHIILDEFSCGILLRELLELYQAGAKEVGPRATSVGSFRDFVAWQAQQDHDPAYWDEALDGFEGPTDWGIERPVRGDCTCAEACTLSLPREQSEELRRLARTMRLPLNTVFIGALALLLRRYSGQSNVTLGLTLLGRAAQIPGIDTMVGNFLNTLPLHVRTDPQEPLSTFLARLHEQVLHLREHHGTALASLRPPDGDNRVRQLFRTLLVFDSNPLFVQSDTLTMSDIRTVEQTNYAINLLVHEGDTIHLRALFNAERFSSDAIRALLGHWRTLLEHLPGMTQEPINGRWMSLADTRESAPAGRGASTVRALVHDQFSVRASRHADGIALAHGSRQMTAGQLGRRAHRLAARLRQEGVVSGQAVGLWLDNAPDTIVAVVAIARVGAVLVPLQPSYTENQLEAILEATSIGCIVSPEPRTPSLGIVPLYLEGDTNDSAAGSVADAAHSTDQDANAIAELLGKPACAIPRTPNPRTADTSDVEISYVTHAKLAALADDPMFTPDSEEQVGVVVTPDSLLLAVWPTLVRGGTLRMPPTAALTATTALRDWLVADDITSCYIPSEHMAALAGMSMPACRLKRAITGWQHLAFRPPTGHSVDIINVFGLGASTSAALAVAVSGDGIDFYGQSVADQPCTVRDIDGHAVLSGMPGELAIAVPPHPTGLRAVQETNGQIRILGPVERRPWIDGDLLDPAEIEALLLAHPGVGVAIVGLRSTDESSADSTTSARLLAWVLAQAGERPSPQVLYEHLRSYLPRHRVPESPKSIVFIEAVPFDAEGRIARERLPIPGQPERVARSATPRNEQEQRLVDIWRQVLGREDIGIHDDFFSLGGDSILAFQIIARASRARIEITSRQLFSNPTVAELVQQARANSDRPVRQPTAVRRRRIAPLLPIQRWFFESPPDDAAQFSHSVLLGLAPEFTPDVVRTALVHLTDHHEALRARFRQASTGIRQEIRAQVEPVIDVIEVPMPAGDEEPQAVLAATAAYLNCPDSGLDLSEGPLWRCAYFDHGNGIAGHLLIVVHHLVIDVVSWRILLEDLQQACEQLSRGEPVALLAVRNSFADWGSSLVSWARTHAVSERSYWLNQLAGGQLPRDRDGQNDMEQTAQARVALESQLTDVLLRELVGAARPADILLTALVQTVNLWTEREELAVMLEGHGRKSPHVDDLDIDASRTVGWFTALYPLRLSLAGTADARAALARVSASIDEVPSGGIGYGVLRYIAHDEVLLEGLDSHSEPELAFNYVGRVEASHPDGPMRVVGGRGTIEFTRSGGRRRHLIDVDVLVDNRTGETRMWVQWTYCQAIHDRATIDALAARHLDNVRSLVNEIRSYGEKPASVADFPLAKLDQTQLARILGKYDNPSKK